MSYRGEAVELGAEVCQVAALAGATMGEDEVIATSMIIYRAIHYGRTGKPTTEREKTELARRFGVTWTDYAFRSRTPTDSEPEPEEPER